MTEAEVKEAQDLLEKRKKLVERNATIGDHKLHSIEIATLAVENGGVRVYSNNLVGAEPLSKGAESALMAAYRNGMQLEVDEIDDRLTQLGVEVKD